MINIKIARLVTIIVLMLSLSSLSIIANAENVPLSEEGIEKIGLNKIRLENGIGVLVFNLSESGERFKGEGYLTLSNTYNSSAYISYNVVTELSSVDLDDYGQPRIHHKVSDNVTFYPVPTSSWITIEGDKATIDPLSVYHFRYKIDIPVESLGEIDTNKGYLMYVNIGKDIENLTGAQIGIDYNYKLFIMFIGKKEANAFSIEGIYIPLLIVGIVGIASVSIVLIGKKRKTLVTKKPVVNGFSPEKTIMPKIKEAMPKIDNSSIDDKIDAILNGRRI